MGKPVESLLECVFEVPSLTRHSWPRDATRELCKEFTSNYCCWSCSLGVNSFVQSAGIILKLGKPPTTRTNKKFAETRRLHSWLVFCSILSFSSNELFLVVCFKSNALCSIYKRNLRSKVPAFGLLVWCFV